MGRSFLPTTQALRRISRSFIWRRHLAPLVATLLELINRSVVEEELQAAQAEGRRRDTSSSAERRRNGEQVAYRHSADLREMRNSMDLVKRMEEYRERGRALAWEGTFAQYFEIAKRQPSVAQLSHERIFSMIMAAGTRLVPRARPQHKFFDDEIFGLEKPLQQIVEYFSSARSGWRCASASCC